MINFRDINENVSEVYNKKKYLGIIIRVAGGYQYRPHRTDIDQWGEIHHNMDQCKDSLL